MGFDFGVARITYLSRPRGQAYDFLKELALDDIDESQWGFSAECNAFVEFSKRRMLSKARSFVKRKSLSEQEMGNLLAWVQGLPWDGSNIILHIYW